MVLDRTGWHSMALIDTVCVICIVKLELQLKLNQWMSGNKDRINISSEGISRYKSGKHYMRLDNNGNNGMSGTKLRNIIERK